MEDKETFGITKKKLEHSAVPRLNEHPETNIKMAAGAGAGGVVSKTKHSKTKTEARSTQISKTKHPKLDNEDP